MIRKVIYLPFLLLFLFQNSLLSQHSVAREWNEVLLEAIREDFARPTVHARNLFHVSLAMYDAWAVFDKEAEPFLLGKTVGGFTCPFDGVAAPVDVKAAQEKALSYAAYQVLRHRFQNSPGGLTTLARFDDLMVELGYDISVVSTDYNGGDPAAIGNYLAQNIIDFGHQDGANEQGGYGNLYYEPVNPPLILEFSGNPGLEDPNRWQPLSFDVFIDQSGNPFPINTPDFLSPEWGIVTPFSLQEEDLTIYQRDGFDYWVYHDPGAPPYINTTEVGGLSEEYKWGFSLVSVWSGHLDPSDGVTWDISPASIGNIQEYPTTIEGLRDFYNLEEGGDPGTGYDINPRTGQPYEPQIVPRADYARVLAEFWADGPDSETPPGHWFTILNYVNDHPELGRQFGGQGEVLDPLEWDVKSYFMLGGAMHDVAVSSWGIKGWYDYIRPISAIRSMAARGQSSDPNLPSYHPGGIHLVPGYIELVGENDPLAGPNGVDTGKIKLFAWKGHDYISNPETDEAGVGWILAENWWPYQRPSFVTPPFAGYVSGHSTYSRAAAVILTLLTGDPFFPGGLGEFPAPQNDFLVFEDGPSVDITLQWATYQDASDQCSLSRIWGGIHPPADDMPGRLIGQEIGEEAFAYAESFFYTDGDADGYYSYEDCDDNDASRNPGAAEVCDDIDNNCDGTADEDLPVFTWYEDVDGDSFGSSESFIETCASEPPPGYVANAMDCNDADKFLNPEASEVCDGLDNNCDGSIDEGLPVFTWYEDSDGDSYGAAESAIDTCGGELPAGYVTNDMDCDDTNETVFPGAEEIIDGLDNDCNGMVDDLTAISEPGEHPWKIYPNPASEIIHIQYETSRRMTVRIMRIDGTTIKEEMLQFDQGMALFSLRGLPQGVYLLVLSDREGRRHLAGRIVKL